jgi:hypothetical protein
MEGSRGVESEGEWSGGADGIQWITQQNSMLDIKADRDTT